MDGAKTLLLELAKAGVKELKQIGRAEFVDQFGRRIRFKRVIERGLVKWTFEFI